MATCKSTANEFRQNILEQPLVSCKKRELMINDITLRLLVQIVTDGSFQSTQIKIEVAKPYKVERVSKLLALSGLIYSHNARPPRPTQTLTTHQFNINTESSSILKNYLSDIKQLPDWFSKLDAEQAKIVFQEYALTDGCFTSNNPDALEVSSANHQDIKVLKELNDLYFGCKVWEYIRRNSQKNENWKDIYMIRFYDIAKHLLDA